MCRGIFEKLTGYVFKKQRYVVLRSDFKKSDQIFYPKYGKLEFDGACEELKIFFEHNGELHYNYGRGMFAKSDPARNMACDRAKLKMVKRMGLDLCVIPYTVQNKDLTNYIRSWLKENGYID